MTPPLTPRDPDFEARVRESFARQQMMASLGTTLTVVKPGAVEIVLPFDERFTQQNCYMHAAAITAIADSSCGYAALTLRPPGEDVLSVEFKLNLLAPAQGESFIARGHVARPGRTLTVCSSEALAVSDGDERLVALMQATIMALP